MVSRSLDKITTVIIHCAATPNGEPLTIDQIDDWHGPGREAQGRTPFTRRPFLAKHHQPHLKHVGYHYVIGVDGVLEFGRALIEVGAHAYKHNNDSIGICLIGLDQFTPAQWTTLKSLFLTLEQTLPNLVKVIGHYEVASHKTCPCFDVPAWRASGYKPPLESIFKLPTTTQEN